MMTRLQLRILLIVLGVIAFSVALRTGIPWLRWVGIGGVGSALLLRFLPARRD